MLLYIIKVSVLEKPRGQLSTFSNLEVKYYNYILRNGVKDKKIKLSSEAVSLNEKEHIKINMVGKPYYKWLKM